MSSVQKNYTLDEIAVAAEWLWRQVKNYKTIALHGDIGAGKTTLVHALCAYLGVSDAVGSPTFSIINEYRFADAGNPQTIYHIDLFRLKDEAEAIQAGVEDCLYSGHYCFAEWPERAPGLFPEDTLHVLLSVIDEKERVIKIVQN